MKPWELPKWAVAQARQLGLELTPEAARMLVGHVGERQQRLLRELEKLALELERGRATIDIDADMVLELTAASAERKAWALADALLSGNAATATRTLPADARSGRTAAGSDLLDELTRTPGAPDRARLDRGESQAQVKSGLRMPPSAADKLIADAKRLGAERLERRST